MATRYPYTTHTKPPLVLDVQQDGEEWVVTLAGDRIKEQARTRTKAAALVAANEIWEHYEERKRAET